MVSIVYISDDSHRIAHSHGVIWNVVGHDSAGSDHHVVADGDSHQHGRIAANPHFAAYDDKACPHNILSPVLQGQVRG